MKPSAPSHGLFGFADDPLFSGEKPISVGEFMTYKIRVITSGLSHFNP